MKTSPEISNSSSPPIEQKKTSKNRRQKRKSLQLHQEILFAQLTAQLRAANLPNAATSSAMSIRSRCSSAPASEHGGFDDDEQQMLTKQNENFEEEENLIDWDEPTRPDDGKNLSSTNKFTDLFLLLMTHSSHVDESEKFTRLAFFLFFDDGDLFHRQKTNYRWDWSIFFLSFSSFSASHDDEKEKKYRKTIFSSYLSYFRFRCLCRTNRRI